MSDILVQIRKDQLQHRKDRNAVEAAILTTLIGDLENESKSKALTDLKVIAKIKNYISTAETNLATAPAMADKTNVEISVLSSYLPTPVTVAELTTIIGDLKAEGKNIGQVMGYLVANFGGRYDGAEAKRIYEL